MCCQIFTAFRVKLTYIFYKYFFTYCKKYYLDYDICLFEVLPSYLKQNLRGTLLLLVILFLDFLLFIVTSNKWQHKIFFSL